MAASGVSVRLRVFEHASYVWDQHGNWKGCDRRTDRMPGDPFQMTGILSGWMERTQLSNRGEAVLLRHKALGLAHARLTTCPSRTADVVII